MIGFSLLTDKQAKILTLDNNQKTEEQRFNDDTIRRFIILVARNEFFDEQGKLLIYSKINTTLEHKNPTGHKHATNTIKRMLAE